MGVWVWERIGKRVYQPVGIWSPAGWMKDDPRGFDLVDAIEEAEKNTVKEEFAKELSLWAERKSKQTGSQLYQKFLEATNLASLGGGHAGVVRTAAEFAAAHNIQLKHMRQLLLVAKVPIDSSLYTAEEQTFIIKRVVNGELDRDRAIEYYGPAAREILRGVESGKPEVACTSDPELEEDSF